MFFARQFNATGAASMDAWDGYRASRARIQQGWLDRGVRNPVVLTGDVHRAWANDLKADYANPTSATIGTELVCTSIASGGNGSGRDRDPERGHQPAPEVLLRPARLRAHHDRPDARSAPTSGRSPPSPSTAPPVTTPESFVILDGHPGLQAV